MYTPVPNNFTFDKGIKTNTIPHNTNPSQFFQNRSSKLIKKKILKSPGKIGPKAENSRFVQIQKKSTASLSPVQKEFVKKPLSQSCVYHSNQADLKKSTEKSLSNFVQYQSLKSIGNSQSGFRKASSLLLHESTENKVQTEKLFDKISNEFRESLLNAEKEDRLENSKHKSIPISAKHRIFQDFEQKSSFSKPKNEEQQIEGQSSESNASVSIKILKAEEENTFGKVRRAKKVNED